jgi:hypothetical protein
MRDYISLNYIYAVGGKKMKHNFLKVAILLSIALLTSTVTAMAFQQNTNKIVPKLDLSNALEINGLANKHLHKSVWTRMADITEGARLDTDFNAKWLAEWWYLNGKVRLVSMNGEQKDLGFFVVVGHQESVEWLALPVEFSNLLHFYGLYFQDDDSPPIISYTDTYVPRSTIEEYVGLRTPYVNFEYNFNDDRVRMYGSGLNGYKLTYIPHDSGLAMKICFRPRMIKTIDQADYPLPFNTYERAYGSLSGTISLEGKKYWIIPSKSEGYFDHMMSRSLNEIWTREFHGWNWLEVTTESYQAILYAIRSLEDGYDQYSFKKLTILDKRTGRIMAEYVGDDVQIMETNWEDWIEDTSYKRPTSVDISTTDGKNIHVEPAMENVFDRRTEHPLLGNIGFVDFMGYQPDGSTIECEAGTIESGSSFSEYLITVPPPQ